MNAIIERAKATLRDASERFTEEYVAISDDRVIGAQDADALHARILRADAIWEQAVRVYDETLRWEGVSPPCLR